MTAKLDRCGIACIHEEAVNEVQQCMIGDEKVRDIADIFKALADPTRVKILFALMIRELCVCDLAVVIGASDSSISHQLRILRTQKIVKNRRDGKILFYSMANDHVAALLKHGMADANNCEIQANKGIKGQQDT